MILKDLIDATDNKVYVVDKNGNGGFYDTIPNKDKADTAEVENVLAMYIENIETLPFLHVRLKGVI